MRRSQARKRIARLDQIALSKTTQKGLATSLATAVKDAHQERGGLTLVVVNRVARAQELYRALLRAGLPEDRLALVHSRFRSPDRARQEQFLARDRTDTRIVVATQAVEAGVDVSARTLFTASRRGPRWCSAWGAATATESSTMPPCTGST